MATPTDEAVLLCPTCKTKHLIRRKKNRLKKEGHYKNFYCYVCKHMHNHIELRPDGVYSDKDLDDLIAKMKENGAYDEVI